MTAPHEFVTLTWSSDLQKRVRTGDWDAQTVSTVQHVEDALHAGRSELAAEFIDYFMEEAKVCHVIYRSWENGLGSWLRREGMDDDAWATEAARLRRLLRFPDGEDFDPVPRWDRLGAHAGSLANRIRGGETSGNDAIAEFDQLREEWRQLHDRWVDFYGGVLTFVASAFGEARLEDAFRGMIQEFIQERYMPFDLRERDYKDTLFRNLYITFEGMRAHLSGAARRGDLELEEHDDRWEIRFDPCGSGGRFLRGDTVEGTGPRPEPPYSFGVTQEEHDWAWNKKGVCYYCAHCCFTFEVLPLERWGHPLKVVDPPTYPDGVTRQPQQKCQWTIYKSLDAIPHEAYERHGYKKPTSDDE
jgi:hypothetical protein